MKFKDETYQDNLTSYFYLDERIASVYEAIEDAQRRLDNQNHYTRVEFHNLGISVRNFSVEREVIDNADAERLALNRIERLRKRQSRFKHLLNELDPQEQFYLKEKYEQGKDIKEQPDIEEKALVLYAEMEAYKHELSRYRQSSFERAERFKEQQETKERIEASKKRDEQATEYDEWLDDIEQDEELSTKWADNGILTRLKNLQR